MPANEPHPPESTSPEARPVAAPAADGHSVTVAAAPSPPPRPAPAWRQHLKRWLLRGGIGLVVLALVLYFGIPWLIRTLNTVSTDDAYVDGHVTFVAPRVAGQVKEVFVDDNFRVKKGGKLVTLDKTPFKIQVEIKQAAVKVAETNLEAARAQVQSQVAQARSNRFKLEHAIEDVKNQIANLRASVAAYRSKKATLALAQANLKRGEELAPTGGISKEDLDIRRQNVKVSEAAVEQALQTVEAIRVGLGLPAEPSAGHDLAEAPADLDQSFSAVRQALGDLMQSAAQFGYYPTTWDATPSQAVADFYKQDPKGNLDKIYARIIPNAPAIKQAEAKLLEARRNLEDAQLNLSYCDIPSDIDGVVTRRNVNPGNYVQVGQNLMAVRSLREIWINANFKETQLADLRIGQRAVIDIDMYGSHHEFEGRITGFTMGTGQTLALLPPQNATGNFVKIVQRLPVRIELTNYNPDPSPLFVGLSCTPYVYYKEPATGPHAGDVLQPFAPLPKVPLYP